MYQFEPKALGTGNASEFVDLRKAAAEGGGFDFASWQFTGDETFSCPVWPGGDLASVTELPVSFYVPEGGFFDASRPTIQFDFPKSVMDAIAEPGNWRTRLTLADLSELLFEGVIPVYAGPGSRAVRATYCTYRDLTSICPWLGQLEDEFRDPTGFIEQRADAAEWAGQVVMNSVPRSAGCGLRSYANYWTWGDGSDLYRRYADALTSLDITSPNGRQIVKATAYKALSLILVRCVGTSATSSDLIALASQFERMADREIVCCTAHFPGTDLRSLNLGVARRR